MGVGLRSCAGFVLAMSIVGCGREAAPGAAAPTLPTRVVSLHDVTTDLIVALGEQARLVGVSAPIDLTSDVAGLIASVPRVSGLESVLAARPELVVGLGVTAEREPELVARVQEAGVALYLADPATLDDVYALTRALAQRLGVEARGEQLVAQLRTQAGPSAAAAGEARRVFVYDCCDPPFTAGGKSVLSDLIARAGGRNVFSQLDSDWSHVSWEDVVARKPELIVVHAYRYEGQADAADKQRALRAIPGLAQVPTAVLPLGCSLGGRRSVEGIERLRAALGGRS